MIELLASRGYIMLNKCLIKLIGLDEAIILGELISEYIYWRDRDKLEDRYFYSTRDNIEDNTGLSPFRQRSAIKKLVKMGLITTKYKGVPAKKWYKINEENIDKLLDGKEIKNHEKSNTKTSSQGVKKCNVQKSNDLTSRPSQTKHQDVKKFNINNNNNNNKKNNNQSIISYESLIKDNIEYDILTQAEEDREIIDEIVSIAIDSINTKEVYIKINQSTVPRELVKSRLLKLTAGHIEYVINSLRKSRNIIYNIKSYIITTLYNSISTFNLDILLTSSRLSNVGA